MDNKGKKIEEEPSASSTLASSSHTSNTDGPTRAKRGKRTGGLQRTYSFAIPKDSTPIEMPLLQSSYAIRKATKEVPLFHRTPVFFWYGLLILAYLITSGIIFGLFEHDYFYHKPDDAGAGSAPDHVDENVKKEQDAQRDELKEFTGDSSYNNLATAGVLILSTVLIGGAQLFIRKKNYDKLRFVLEKDLDLIVRGNKSAVKWPSTPDQVKHIVNRFAELIGDLAADNEWTAIARFLLACKDLYSVHIHDFFNKHITNNDDVYRNGELVKQLGRRNTIRILNKQTVYENPSLLEEYLARYADYQKGPEDSEHNKLTEERVFVHGMTSIRNEGESLIPKIPLKYIRENIVHLLMTALAINLKSYAKVNPSNSKKMASMLQEFFEDSEETFNPTRRNMHRNTIFLMYFVGLYDNEHDLDDININILNPDCIKAFKNLKPKYQAKLLLYLLAFRKVTSDFAQELFHSLRSDAKKQATLLTSYLALAKTLFDDTNDAVTDFDLVPLHVRLWLLTRIKTATGSTFIPSDCLLELCKTHPKSALPILYEMNVGTERVFQDLGKTPNAASISGDPQKVQTVKEGIAVRNHINQIFERLEEKSQENLLFEQPIDKIKTFTRLLNYQTRYNICKRKIYAQLKNRGNGDKEATFFYEIYTKLIQDLPAADPNKHSPTYMQFLTTLYQQSLSETWIWPKREMLVRLGIRGGILYAAQGNYDIDLLFEYLLTDQMILLFKKDNEDYRKPPIPTFTSTQYQSSNSESSSSSSTTVSSSSASPHPTESRKDILNQLESADAIIQALACELMNVYSDACEEGKNLQAKNLTTAFEQLAIRFDNGGSFPKLSYLVNTLYGITQSYASNEQKYQILFTFFREYLNVIDFYNTKGVFYSYIGIFGHLNERAQYLSIKRVNFNAIDLFFNVLKQLLSDANKQLKEKTPPNAAKYFRSFEKGSEDIKKETQLFNNAFDMLHNTFAKEAVKLENKQRNILISLLPYIQQSPNFVEQKKCYLPTMLLLANLFSVDHSWPLTDEQVRIFYKFCKRFAEGLTTHNTNFLSALRRIYTINVNQLPKIPAEADNWLKKTSPPKSAAWGLAVILQVTPALQSGVGGLESSSKGKEKYHTAITIIDHSKSAKKLMATAVIAYYYRSKSKTMTFSSIDIWTEIKGLVAMIWDTSNPANVELEIKESINALGLKQTNFANSIKVQLYKDQNTKLSRNLPSESIQDDEQKPLIRNGSSSSS